MLIRRLHLIESGGFMKQGIMKGVAIVIFAAAMSVSGTASAAVPNIACTTSLEGRVVYTQSGSWRYYYQCRTRQWIFLRACPIGGGSCIY
jgi:hypothetical protein